MDAAVRTTLSSGRGAHMVGQSAGLESGSGTQRLGGAHRLDRDAVLLALLTLHQEGSVLAGRALLQLMLGKLISLTRHARVAGFDSYHAYDERAATTIATFMSLIAEYRPSGENIYAALFCGL
ncbi:hypothetical protein GCM10020255_002800 [Rhodococcus baikonurensis]